MFNKNKKVVTKKVLGMEDHAPNLVVKVKQVSKKKFEISIIHPNTKTPLYCKVHIVVDAREALALGNNLKNTKYSDVKTWYEEILHIPRPRRGKVDLKTKESEQEKNEKGKKY